MTTTTSVQAALTPVIEPHTQRWLDELAAASAGSPPLPDRAQRAEITASPLQASVDQLRGLPPALIINGEHDVLRDEG